MQRALHQMGLMTPHICNAYRHTVSEEFEVTQGP
jgi:hypothetical protein